MRLDKFITRQRIIDLASVNLEEALTELLAASISRFPDLNPDALLKRMLQRENTMTTYLGLGVALPHVRVKMGRRYILAIGRSQAGIRYDGVKESERLHLIIMLIADEGARDYLHVLAALARLVKEPEFVNSLIQAPDLDVFYERLVSGLGGIAARPVQLQQNRVNRIILREAERVARGCGCVAVLVFGDTFAGAIEARRWFGAIKAFLVTRNLAEAGDERKGFAEIIQVRSFSSQRLAQLRSAVLVALTRGLIAFNDRLCCVSGMAGSNQFDTVVVVDVEREFQTLLTGHADLLPPDVKPEVIERVLAIATELAIEGREGRPVGGLFVVGDTEKGQKFTKPLVLNPFHGYKEEDRNILSPFMDETIKEFSSIDGAFVIRGDGVVESAGSLVQAADYEHALPSGLGSRHAAAAAISIATQCVAIVISSSGQVVLFRRGVMLPLTEKRFGTGE
ncbi:MAG: hypothetical protein A3G75_07330 [Verrucomicrobia bacterium RIFCSPLOWO2_12_FULL_64_8]|nr:MAG: hypothetical protein A3G75_07330 [Verrucomicrobia bacterium RIFCSPLOWO2_12_FULL_64_8]